MSFGLYAEDFDIPVTAPKWSPRIMFSQGHVSVRKLVQSYDVGVPTCGTFLVPDMCRSLLVRLVHLVPWFMGSSGVGK